MNYVYSSLCRLNKEPLPLRFSARFKSKKGYIEVDWVAKQATTGIFILTGRELVEVCDFCENSPLTLHKISLDGTIIWANKSELNNLGYEWEEYVGHPITE